MSNVIDSIQLSGVTYTIQGSGGGKAIEAGRGISITTGETADTVSFNLPISAGTGTNSVIEGSTSNFARGNYAHAEGSNTKASGQYSHAEGYLSEASGEGSHAEGASTSTKYYSHGEGIATFAVGNYSHAEGDGTTAATESSHAEGRYTITKNNAEHASGQYNNSVSASTTFGDSGNTLFSVGNGTATNARHNAFEIRQNGDIYLTKDGQDVKLQDQLGGGGGNPTVELTQAEYDALVTAGTVSPNTYYIITDAQAGDLSQYWTSAQTNSAITQATSGKVDTTTYNTYTAATDTALGGKQATLVSGTNIKTINNESILGSGNIDIQGGGGGGKAIAAGTNISITTGETADTINCTLPYYKLNDDNYSIFGQTHPAFINKATNAYQSMFIGITNEVNGDDSVRKYYDNFVIGNNNKINSHITDYSKGYNVVIGNYNRLSGTNLSDSYVIGKRNSGYTSNTLLTGWYNQAYNNSESTFGKYNNSVSGSSTFGDSGNTLFSVGNGTSLNDRHNAFEIRQNGDIYLSLNGQDVKLQDQLGGGGSSYSAGTGIDITNDVISVSGVVMSSAITTSITSSSTDAQVPSAKAVYDAIQEGGGAVDQTIISGSTNAVAGGAVYSKIDEVEQVTAAGLNALNDAFGGLKLMKISQTDYDNLQVKDQNTLYIIVN